ncbi:MAG: patatin-like phospholipase family protein [Chitinophagaceae bacterium]
MLKSPAIQYSVLEPRQPEKIGLSFSGGGFRAAGYTLGCLSYMDTLNMGDKKFTDIVHFISSASGGSITSMAFVAGQRKGETFPAFYQRLYTNLFDGTQLINRVFAILNNNELAKKRPGKSKNFINAFAMAYDELIFNKEQFAVFWENPEKGIKEICINSTEFDNGMLFRFQSDGNIESKIYIGSDFLHFHTNKQGIKVAQKMLLGDILAASSCFTVGFEPIVFPNDFAHGRLNADELIDAMTVDTRYSPVKDDTEPKPLIFSLMDGGIDDNQGIDSFIRAEDRLQNRNSFGHDLYITCDVSSNYTTGYDFPVENKKSGWFFSMYHLILVILMLFGASIYGISTHTCLAISYVVLGISSLLILLIAYFTYKIVKARHRASKRKDTYGILLLNHLNFFLKIKIRTLLQLLHVRVSSAGYLAAVIFLKKIRRISYSRIFEKITELKFITNDTLIKSDDHHSEAASIKLKHWSDFTLVNAIYLLTKKNDHQRKEDLTEEKWHDQHISVNYNGTNYPLAELMNPAILPGGSGHSAMQHVASVATEMDTTLWFDENHFARQQPAALIITGQFTTCYNLLLYAFRFDPTIDYWKKIQDQLVADWIHFLKDPCWQYNEYGKSIPGFTPITAADIN